MFTIDVEISSVLKALEHAPASLERYTKPEARVTADRISAEAQRRVRRLTGETARHIRVEESHDRAGYVVVTNDRTTKEHVDVYLEFGTEHMSAFPYFFNSARMEEGAHHRRMLQAIQEGLDAMGLGD